MAKYSKGAQKSVETAMKRMEKGKLESGRSGKKVTNPKQAIAIGLSEARKKGAKVPKKAAPKTATKKSAPKKTVAKKTSPKKAVAVKKTAPKKAAAKKSVAAKKTAPKKAAAPKKAIKKTASKKTALVRKIFADKNLNKKTTKTNANEEAVSIPAHDETVGKAANLENDGTADNDNNTNSNEPGIKDDGLKAPVKIEDPVTAADQKGYNRATTKGDPHQKLHLSSAKGGIKPSGKKPLWNR